MDAHGPELALRRLGAWYRAHGRHDLPWRHTRDRYAVLVSEVMLQQTQVERVIPYWQAWMERWPEVSSLAAASPAEVIRAWSGLGYNRRAVNLHRAAVAVVEDFDGRLPGDPGALRLLPGIGSYTANAVACFADGRRVPVLDTNIRRVIARAAGGRADGRDGTEATLAGELEPLLPWRGARERTLALMDLGALVCRARGPACGACPLRDGCAWRSRGYPAERGQGPQQGGRFEETARFARGRIVEWLRARAAGTEAELASALPGHHAARLHDYLSGLARDGLVEQSANGEWHLPDGWFREE